jgi:hypothetical protein
LFTIYPGYSWAIASNNNRSLWIRSQQWYAGLRGNRWVGPRSESSSVSRRSQKYSVLEVRRRSSTVPSVGPAKLSVL